MNEPGIVSLHAICLAVYQYGLPGSLSFRTRAQCSRRCSREQNIMCVLSLQHEEFVAFARDEAAEGKTYSHLDVFVVKHWF